MSRVLYYLVLKPVSLLPPPLLYALSDFLFMVLYKMAGYRTKVVRNNLKNAFPNKSDAERRAIEAKFYRHFFDLIVEGIRNFSISKAELIRRCPVTNPEIFEQYAAQNKSLIIVAGHYNNWEMAAMACAPQIAYDAIAIYSPLKDPFMDKKAKASRSKYGLEMISTKIVKKVFENYRGQLTATMFGADQSPSNARNAHWMTFLNQETAVLWGTEKYAKEYNYPVIYGHIAKLRRGYYNMTFTTLEDHPVNTPVGYITEKHTKMLEQHILEKPEYWLWTHRRWKKKREE